MKYNLQFFADEEVSTGVEATEPATQSETVNPADNTTEEVVEQSPDEAQTSPQPTEESVDRNAIFAEARRTFEKKQNAINARYAERFKGLVNPETNKPITTPDEYLEALDAQERMAQQRELEEKGVDINTLNKLIENSPRLKQAERMLAEYEQQKVLDAIDADVANLTKLDPNIKDINSVPKEVLEHAKNNNITLTLAYKDLYFGKVNAQQTQAIQQKTINQIAGKAHLAPANGVVANDGLVDIPANEYSTWQEAFPHLSAAELKKKYNRSLTR